MPYSEIEDVLPSTVGIAMGTMVINDDTLDMTSRNGDLANPVLGINDDLWNSQTIFWWVNENIILWVVIGYRTSIED